ncbi:hypothetical protein NE865_02292 [Phthorimaea operculella]|nr:hypothetical protein NE865_02292 [Phthorimaea operculella]
MDVLTNVLLQNVILPSPVSQVTINSSEPSETIDLTALAGRDPKPGPTGSALEMSLQRPVPAVTSNPAEPRLLNLGLVNTSLKDPKVLAADPGHLKLLESLQKFGEPSWKDVRYTDALKAHNATPGFVDLENLQDFVNWTAQPGAVLTSENIFDKISELFQPSSKFHKVSEEIMQMVCGKRAEFIETRRERILSEVSNKNLSEGLRRIPPSSKHLFDDAQLRAYIQSTGGIDKWVRPWYQPSKEPHKSVPKVNNKVNKPSTSKDFPQRPFRRENEFHTKKPNFGNRQADQFRRKFVKKENGFNKKHTDK